MDFSREHTPRTADSRAPQGQSSGTFMLDRKRLADLS